MEVGTMEPKFMKQCLASFQYQFLHFNDHPSFTNFWDADSASQVIICLITEVTNNHCLKACCCAEKSLQLFECFKIGNESIDWTRTGAIFDVDMKFSETQFLKKESETGQVNRTITHNLPDEIKNILDFSGKITKIFWIFRFFLLVSG